MRWIVSLLCLLATACNGVVPEQARVSLRVDPNAWTAEELTAVERGAQAWQALAPGWVTVELTDQMPNLRRRPIDRAGNVRGRAIGDEIWIDAEDCDAERIAFTVQHEIGHQLGLEHVPAGVMQARITGGEPLPAWSVDDAHECARVGVCAAQDP